MLLPEVQPTYSTRARARAEVRSIPCTFGSLYFRTEVFPYNVVRKYPILPEIDTYEGTSKDISTRMIDNFRIRYLRESYEGFVL